MRIRILAVLIVVVVVAALSLFGPGAARGPVALVGPGTAAADIPWPMQQWIECAGWDGCGGGGAGRYYTL